MPYGYITLCKSISPNIKGNVYYPYTDVNAYYAQVVVPKAVATIEEDNYRIANGILSIHSDVAGMDVYRRVTYVAERRVKDDGSGYVLFFWHVRSVKFQADKALFTIEPDHFANAWGYASFPSAVVNRLSRYEPNREYACRLDYPTHFKNAYALSGLTPIADPLTQSTNGIVIIAQIRFETTSDMFGNSPISNTLNFVYKDSIANARVQLGTIYQVRTTQDSAGTSIHNGKAQLVRAWAIPEAFLPDIHKLDAGGKYRAVYKDVNNGYADALLYDGLAYAYPQTQQYIYSYQLDQSYRSQCYIGTRRAMVAVPRELPYTNIEFETTLNSDGLRVIMRIGDDTTDLTGQFALRITTNSEIASESENVIGSLKNISHMLGGARKTYEKNGSVGLSTSIFENFLGQYNFHDPQPSIGDGDADITFEWISGTGTAAKYKFPIRVYKRTLDMSNTSYESHIVGGSTHIAYFDDDSSVPFKSDMAGTYPQWTPINGRTTDLTFIQADVSVSNVVLEEGDALVKAFRDGFNYNYITTSA